MSYLPKVAVSFSDGNLVTQKAVIDGYAAFIGNAHTGANAGKVYTIASLADAETQGITETLEPEAHRQLKEFYEELGGSQICYLQLTAAGTTMADMLDYTDITAANKVIFAGLGKIAYLGVFKTVPGDYEGGGADYMDADVSAAVTASKTFVQYWNSRSYFFRVLIAGVISDESKSTIYNPNTADCDYAGVLLFSTAADNLASVGLYLGRKVAYPCNIKAGKVANGAVNASALYIGSTKVEEKTNLETLASYGYIVALTYPNKAGYFFGVDYMANDGDYKLLVYGAVADAAARVALSYYLEQLESEISVDAAGKLLDEDAKHLEENIYQQEINALGDRISDVQINIDRGQVIVPGNTFNVKIRVIPDGYFTWVNIDIGLIA